MADKGIILLYMIYSNKNSVFKNLINWLDPSLYFKTRECVTWTFTSTSFMLEMKECFYDLLSPTSLLLCLLNLLSSSLILTLCNIPAPFLLLSETNFVYKNRCYQHYCQSIWFHAVSTYIFTALRSRQSNVNPSCRGNSRWLYMY